MEPEIKVNDFSPDEYNERRVTVQEELLAQDGNPTEYPLRSERTIVFKEADGMASFTIAKLLGGDSLNPALNIYYQVAFCIHKYDNETIRSPRTALEVEAIVARLAKNRDWDSAVVAFQQWNGIDAEGNLVEENNPVKK